MVRRFIAGIKNRRRRREARRALAILRQYLSTRINGKLQINVVEIEFHDEINRIKIIELQRRGYPAEKIYI